MIYSVLLFLFYSLWLSLLSRGACDVWALGKKLDIEQNHNKEWTKKLRSFERGRGPTTEHAGDYPEFAPGLAPAAVTCTPGADVEFATVQKPASKIRFALLNPRVSSCSAICRSSQSPNVNSCTPTHHPQSFPLRFVFIQLASTRPIPVQVPIAMAPQNNKPATLEHLRRAALEQEQLQELFRMAEAFEDINQDPHGGCITAQLDEHRSR